jgi:hypothetical protein
MGKFMELASPTFNHTQGSVRGDEATVAQAFRGWIACYAFDYLIAESQSSGRVILQPKGLLQEP